MNKIYLIGALSLALAACGSPKKSPDANTGDGTGKTKQGQGDGSHLSDSDFKMKCLHDPINYPNAKIVRQNGSSYCIIPRAASVPNNAKQFSVVDVDKDYHPRKWIHAVGQGGSELQLNGVRISGSSYEDVGREADGGGDLTIYVGQSSNSEIEVITYECRDANMNVILCNRGQIYQ